MVARPRQWEPRRLVEDGVVLLEEAVQQWEPRSSGDCGLLLLGRRWWPHHVLPCDPASIALERQGKRCAIPKDQPHRPEEVKADDEVEGPQIEADKRDSEIVIPNADGDIVHNPLASQSITVGDGNPKMLAPRGRETETAHGISLDEVMHRAGVEEGQEVSHLASHRYQHGVQWSDASHRVERHHQGGGGGGPRVVLLRQVVGRVALLPNRVPWLINGLEVEEALADMTASIRLITVEVEALSTSFHLLGRHETPEDAWHPGNSSGGRLEWGSRRRCRCHRSRATATPLLQQLQLL